MMSGMPLLALAMPVSSSASAPWSGCKAEACRRCSGHVRCGDPNLADRRAHPWHSGWSGCRLGGRRPRSRGRPTDRHRPANVLNCGSRCSSWSDTLSVLAGLVPGMLERRLGAGVSFGVVDSVPWRSRSIRAPRPGRDRRRFSATLSGWRLPVDGPNGKSGRGDSREIRVQRSSERCCSAHICTARASRRPPFRLCRLFVRDV